MAAPKTFFEQIPVEAVKRIAKVFPEEDAIGSEGGNTKITEAKSPRESWREVAQNVQHEEDPKRLKELVDQLITKLDQEQLSKRLLSKRDDGNRVD